MFTRLKSCAKSSLEPVAVRHQTGHGASLAQMERNSCTSSDVTLAVPFWTDSCIDRLSAFGMTGKGAYVNPSAAHTVSEVRSTRMVRRRLPAAKGAGTLRSAM